MKELSKIEVEAVLSGKALPGELLTGESMAKYFARLYLHAKEYRDAQIAALEADLNERRKITSLSMGVGDGTGQLFVHGDYDSIKAAQKIVFRSEDLSRQLAQREAQIAGMEIQLSGANERSKMIFEAKNHWSDRARKAEAQLAELEKQVPDYTRYDCGACGHETFTAHYRNICPVCNHRPMKETGLFTRTAPPAPVKLPEPVYSEDGEPWLYRDEVIEAIEEAGGSVADE